MIGGRDPEGPGVRSEPAATRRRAAAGSSFTRSFLGAFARGTGLVAVALVIGIVLLQWSDASTDAAAGGQPPPAGTPVAPPETTTTTTVPAGPRPPAELAVLVLNATGKNQQAKPMADRLAVVGYRTLTPGNATRRDDSVVLCQAGPRPGGGGAGGGDGPAGRHRRPRRGGRLRHGRGVRGRLRGDHRAPGERA